MTRRKIKLNVWRDPQPKAIDYLSPHCTSGNCKWCTTRRRRAKDAATRAQQATVDALPGIFWDSKTGGHQERLGSSAPDAVKPSYVVDPLGYWR